MLSDSESSLCSNATEHICKCQLHPDLSVCEEELNLAGRALAVGLSTAAIVHAMRSVEAGLPVICVILKISLPKLNRLHFIQAMLFQESISVMIRCYRDVYSPIPIHN